MAIVDFSGATLSFNAFDPNNINHNTQVSTSPGHYSWKTTSNFTVTALSPFNNITANGGGPTGGSISSIHVAGLGFNPIFSITGLGAPLTSLVVPGNAAASHEHFWETVLAGATTFVMPQLAGVSAAIFGGDFWTVNSGQILTGANDVFAGIGLPTEHITVGDANAVAANARLNGGNDQFVNLSGTMVGDVGSGGPSNFGVVKGGNDIFVGNGNPLAPTLVIQFAAGDVSQNAFNVSGGADSFKFTNLASAGLIAGDVVANATGSVAGGNDVISVARTGAFYLPATAVNNVVGDVYIAAATAPVKGGNDSISIKDAISASISGDVYSSVSNVTGGNDHIVFASSAPFFGGAPAIAPAPSQAMDLVGDAVQLTGGNFIGGNDRIAVVNATASLVVGDVREGVGVTGVTGGNDKISITWNQVNIAAPTIFSAVGDFGTLSSGGFTGGHDAIAVNLAMGTDQNAYASGDGYLFIGNGSFTGGNDTIVVNSNRTGGTNSLFGDAQFVNTTGAFHGGNDNLTGTNGNDHIYGDAAGITAASDTGGNDVINGRGGNDIINGGKGFDTAVYHTLNQAVHVNLNGIAGSAAMPADYREAIGQGFDQLVGIERIIGSQLGDVVIGDGFANVFDGLGGADYLNGGGGGNSLRGWLGNDTLTGGLGNDFFVFNTAPNTAANRDVITDFSHAADTIQLDNAIFAKLGAAGALNAGFFHVGPAAADANDYIVYNQATGGLFYDANGSAAGGAVMFAVLSTRPAIAANDFVVI